MKALTCFCLRSSSSCAVSRISPWWRGIGRCGVLVLAGLLALSGAEPAGKSDKKYVETEMVRLTPSGFEPAEITRKPGTFQLAVQSFLRRTTTLTLETDSRSVVKSTTKADGPRQRWMDTHTLSAGTYTLRVQENPKFTMKIVIK